MVMLLQLNLEALHESSAAAAFGADVVAVDAAAAAVSVDDHAVGLLGCCRYDLKLKVALEVALRVQIEVCDAVLAVEAAAAAAALDGDGDVVAAATAVVDFDIAQTVAVAVAVETATVIAFPVDYFEVSKQLRPSS